MGIREDAEKIIEASIHEVLPDEAVKKALKDKSFGNGKLYLVAIGKAAWQMANAAVEIVGDRLEKGIVVTKYEHVKGEIPKVDCYEAGHPVPDENSFRATKEAMDMVSDLSKEDTVLFLISGGGSALFENPLVQGEELADITKQLLGCGADIVEINTIRKRLSAVKGGRFAMICNPANVFSIVLSDVLGDPLDMIASGPAYPDNSTAEEALAIVKKYNLAFSDKALELLNTELPKKLDNVETVITGSVRNLCLAAANCCENLGYSPIFLTDRLTCEAREAGRFLGSIAMSNQESDRSIAFIAGGETVVHLTGKGKGGRNQELALAAAEQLSECKDTLIFSLGSDGTDGPTDAAGGIVDNYTKEKLLDKNISIYDTLINNDAYNALNEVEGLIMTGATGSNVNDVTVLLIKRD